MAALTKDRRTPIKAQGTHRHHRRKISNVKVFKGGIAAINAAGHLVPASDAAALVVVGIFEETVDNSAGAAGDLEANYITGVEVELENDGGAIGVDDSQAYVADDQSVTTAAAAANDIYVGPVTEFTDAKVTVIIDEAVNRAPFNAGTPIDGADVGTVATAQVIGGVPVIHVIDIADAASGDTDVVLTEKTEVLRVDVIKIGGAGNAGNAYTVKNGANAITDAIDGDMADKDVASAATIDDAQNVIAAAGTLRVSHVKAGGNSAARVVVYGIKRA